MKLSLLHALHEDAISAEDIPNEPFSGKAAIKLLADMYGGTIKVLKTPSRTYGLNFIDSPEKRQNVAISIFGHRFVTSGPRHERLFWHPHGKIYKAGGPRGREIKTWQRFATAINGILHHNEVDWRSTEKVPEDYYAY